jgi:hypothetical protein
MVGMVKRIEWSEIRHMGCGLMGYGLMGYGLCAKVFQQAHCRRPRPPV